MDKGRYATLVYVSSATVAKRHLLASGELSDVHFSVDFEELSFGLASEEYLRLQRHTGTDTLSHTVHRDIGQMATHTYSTYRYIHAYKRTVKNIHVQWTNQPKQALAQTNNKILVQ